MGASARVTARLERGSCGHGELWERAGRTLGAWGEGSEGSEGSEGPEGPEVPREGSVKISIEVDRIVEPEVDPRSRSRSSSTNPTSTVTLVGFVAILGKLCSGVRFGSCVYCVRVLRPRCFLLTERADQPAHMQPGPGESTVT